MSLRNKSNDCFGTDAGRLTPSEKLLLEWTWLLADASLYFLSAQIETALTRLETNFTKYMQLPRVHMNTLILLRMKGVVAGWVSKKLQPRYSYGCQEDLHMVIDGRQVGEGLESWKGFCANFSSWYHRCKTVISAKSLDGNNLSKVFNPIFLGGDKIIQDYPMVHLS